MVAPTKGKLFLVPTPIGNLGDITTRGLATLSEVDLVACEDTRVSGQLLKHFDLKKKLISYHNFNEAGRAETLVAMLAEGKNIAVVTDAGSPGISDPAFRVVRAALSNNIEVSALPGPTAIIPALTASGLSTDRFFFEGFLSNKSGARRKRLGAMSGYEHTLIFYESPHRVLKALADMRDVLGDRRACLAREISKKFEEYIRGTISNILQVLAARTIKGEIVLVVEGNRRGENDEPSTEEADR